MSFVKQQLSADPIAVTSACAQSLNQTMAISRYCAMPWTRRLAIRAALATFANIILVIVASGCSTSGPPAGAPSATAVPVSFGGNYQGTIQLTSTSSLASGAQSNWCNTPPAISLSLRNNAFSYVLAHPNVPQKNHVIPFPHLFGCSPSRWLVRYNEPKWRSRDDWPHCRVAHDRPDQRSGMRIRIHRRKVLRTRTTRARGRHSYRTIDLADRVRS
jgi:hypothetical protein